MNLKFIFSHPQTEIIHVFNESFQFRISPAKIGKQKHISISNSVFKFRYVPRIHIQDRLYILY